MVTETGSGFINQSDIRRIIFPLEEKAQKSLGTRVFPTREYLNLVENVGDGEFMDGYVGVMKEVALQLELASLFIDEPEKREKLNNLYNKLDHQGHFGYMGEVLRWVNDENRGDIVSYLRDIYEKKFSDLSDQEDTLGQDSMEEYYARAREAVNLVLTYYPQ